MSEAQERDDAHRCCTGLGHLGWVPQDSRSQNPSFSFVHTASLGAQSLCKARGLGAGVPLSLEIFWTGHQGSHCPVVPCPARGKSSEKP